MVDAGTAGPTMNGVMNYGVGTPSHWASLAYIPPYALPMYDQLINRAGWPELWAHDQQHGANADSTWLTNAGQLRSDRATSSLVALCGFEVPAILAARKRVEPRMRRGDK